LNDDDLLLYAKADLIDSEEDSSVSEGLSAGPETKKRKRKTLGRMEKQKRRKLNPTRAPQATHHPELPEDVRNQIARDFRLMRWEALENKWLERNIVAPPRETVRKWNAKQRTGKRLRPRGAPKVVEDLGAVQQALWALQQAQDLRTPSPEQTSSVIHEQARAELVQRLSGARTSLDKRKRHVANMDPRTLKKTRAEAKIRSVKTEQENPKRREAADSICNGVAAAAVWVR
jgi:hypothetical protein